MKDPDSAKIQCVGEPKRDTIRLSITGSRAFSVWVTQVSVNAKNSFGGYVGAQPYLLAWRVSAVGSRKSAALFAFAPPFVASNGVVIPGSWEPAAE
jgi:hypothetical protein